MAALCISHGLFGHTGSSSVHNEANNHHLPQDPKKARKTYSQQQQHQQLPKNSTQQERSIEERFVMKADAMAKGEDDEDAAFNKRLEALKKDARSRSKVSHHTPTSQSWT